MENSSTPSATMNSQGSSSVFSPKTFSNPVSFKLDDENFLTWRHQALAIIKAHKLKYHLVAEKMPKRFCTPKDEEDDKESEEFLNWEQQDQHLVSWLLASMTPPFANRMVGCNYEFQIWEKVQKHFASQTRAKVSQLRTQLKAMKKDGFASKFLLKVKKTTDSPAAIGAPISVEEHIEVILDGLGREYAAFITSVVSRKDPYTIDEIEALLLALIPC